MKKLIKYLGNLRSAKMVLWCYLIWYLVMTGFYFEARLSLWLNSLGISLVIGTGLLLGVLPPGGLHRVEKWLVARLYMMPFGVSSFAALIKNQGFVVIFSPRFAENASAAAVCALFVTVAVICKAALTAR
jgi:hypothetical protein